MSNVAPIKIDTTDGKLPIKEKGLVFQEFANPAEERRNQLEKLAAGFRLFDYFGFNEGVAGHITYRDPEFKDHFLGKSSWCSLLTNFSIRSFIS